MPQPLMVVLALASLGATDAHKSLELLRNTSAMTVQNASPLEEKEVLGEVSVANRSREGDSGFVFNPQLRMGTPWKVEVGAGAEFQDPSGAQGSTTGAVSAYAVGQFVEERGVRPQLALHGEVTSPHGEQGVSAEAALLATKTFGQTRLHANVAYQATRAEPGEYLVGLAVDHPLGHRLLLAGDTYYLKSLDTEPGSLEADLGAGVSVTSAFVVTGTVGLHATAREVAPRVLIGLVGHL